MKKVILACFMTVIGYPFKTNAQSSVLIEPNGTNGILSKNNTGLTAASNSISNPPVAPVSGQGTRLMWIPSRSAFRVGTIYHPSIFAVPPYWEANNIGLFSFAAGVNTQADGWNATAFGQQTRASGANAFALGEYTHAAATGSTAIGTNTFANGNSSIAMGYYAKTASFYSTAAGYYSEALGQASVALGDSSVATARSTIAIGRRNQATLNYATAIGTGNIASNWYATAIGLNNTASGFYATAIGSANQASGEASTAMGINVSTNGYTRSFVIGGHSTPNLVANFADYQMLMSFHTYRFYTQNVGKYVDFGPNGEVTATGAYTNVSDRRLKKDFKPLANSLAHLLKTNTYHYYLKTDTASKDLQTGVIAQEIRELFPELVHEDDKGMLSVNYVGLVPHLIEAVKELKAENEKWKMMNEDLKATTEALNQRLSLMENEWVEWRQMQPHKPAETSLKTMTEPKNK